MIQTNKLNKTYDRRSRHANHVLHDITLELPDTGFVCILGPSGCGKTSLLNALGGLDRFDSGSLTAGDTTVTAYGTQRYEDQRNRSFGYIFQNYYLLMDHTVAYNVYLGLHSLKLSHREKLRRVRQALEAVDMAHYLRRRVADLSGGQQQRIAIARALARQPRVIFADEPTGNLDEANTLNICTLLRQISRTSLVVMVTHEERIAQFFADRIIRLDAGRITQDTQSWEREGLSAGGEKVLYAGDLTESRVDTDSVALRLLTQPGADPVALTVVALQDRIVLKIADPRAVALGENAPQLLEGKRPQLDLDTLDSHAAAMPREELPVTRSGKGLTFGMQLREALSLNRGKGLGQWGMRLFLALLTVLVMLTVSDYLTLASIDPEDFITCDSHVLELDLRQGPTLYPQAKGTYPMVADYYSYLRDSGQDFLFLPHIPTNVTYSIRLFPQMEAIDLRFGKFSYVPLEALDPGTLIAGRLPETSREIVVDRWVLEKALESQGILQNAIPGPEYFLGRTLTYSRKTYAPTVVGICDSGQPSIYMPLAGFVSVGVSGVEVTPLSELRAQYPGVYDRVELDSDQCLVVVNNAGMGYASRIGGTYSASTRRSLTIVDAIEAEVAGRIVVADTLVEELLWDMLNQRFYLYCPDKAAVRSFLDAKASPVETKGYGIIDITDTYQTTYDAYAAASTRKADARSIVTATVMAVCLVMLYLLQRAKARERIGMLAVYRLLGIPRGKLSAIFAMESLLCSLTVALPAGAATLGAIHLARAIPELESQLRLPPAAAGWVLLAIGAYHLAVSLVPAWQLLRLPPAQLAAKFDI